MGGNELESSVPTGSNHQSSRSSLEACASNKNPNIEADEDLEKFNRDLSISLARYFVHTAPSMPENIKRECETLLFSDDYKHNKQSAKWPVRHRIHQRMIRKDGDCRPNEMTYPNYWLLVGIYTAKHPTIERLRKLLSVRYTVDLPKDGMYPGPPVFYITTGGARGKKVPIFKEESDGVEQNIFPTNPQALTIEPLQDNTDSDDEPLVAYLSRKREGISQGHEKNTNSDATDSKKRKLDATMGTETEDRGPTNDIPTLQLRVTALEKELLAVKQESDQKVWEIKQDYLMDFRTHKREVSKLKKDYEERLSRAEHRSREAQMKMYEMMNIRDHVSEPLVETWQNNNDE